MFVERMAELLKLPEPYLLSVAHNASHRYAEFQIKKSDGVSFRKIEQPSKELKFLQRWLVRRIFERLPTHECAHAYVQGRSIRSNAERHLRQRYISRLDLRNFFPSLTADDIQNLLRERRALLAPVFDLNDDDRRFVCALVCRFGRLTIGAPSSPSVSNKLLYDLDLQIALLSEQAGVRFTRYADDLYFSTSQPETLFDLCARVTELISNSLSPKLVINEAKTYHASGKKRKVVTGLRITPDGRISVGRELKRKIRVFAHRARLKKLNADEQAWLEGMLAYVSSIEPWYSSKIQSKYQV
jgi:RNA-directed DNA polymerase